MGFSMATVVSIDMSRFKQRMAAVKAQIPFAASVALNQTAQAVQQKETAALPEVFDRPTPFTMAAIAVERSSKTNLVAKVFIKPIQLQYLKLEIDGGTRTPAKRALLVPAGVALNQYGNMGRNKIQQLLARRDTFSGVIHGVAGIWQRTKKGPPKLLVRYQGKASYRPRFPFYQIAQRTILETLGRNMGSAIDYALRTAK
jgi:hypothetical protein